MTNLTSIKPFRHQFLNFYYFPFQIADSADKNMLNGSNMNSSGFFFTSTVNRSILPQGYHVFSSVNGVATNQLKLLRMISLESISLGFFKTFFANISMGFQLWTKQLSGLPIKPKHGFFFVISHHLYNASFEAPSESDRHE